MENHEYSQWRLCENTSTLCLFHVGLTPSPCHLGETRTTVSPYVPGGVSDGQWHSVQLHYYNKVSGLRLQDELLGLVEIWRA